MTYRVGEIKRGIEWIRTRAYDVRWANHRDALPDLNALADFAEKHLSDLGCMKPLPIREIYKILIDIQSQTAAPNILQLTQDGLKIIRDLK